MGGREEEVRGYRTGVTWSAKGAGPQRSGRPGRLARNLQRDGSVRACSPDGSGTAKAVTETAVAVTAAAVAAAMTLTHPAHTNSLSRLQAPPSTNTANRRAPSGVPAHKEASHYPIGHRDGAVEGSVTSEVT